VIFLQKDHHAIAKFDTLWLLRLEGGQLRDRDLFPVRHLCRDAWKRECDGSYEHQQ
jgi:hypothetical protein